MDWVETERTLSHFSGSPDLYRDFVEAGRGEKPVSPFERAVAGLVFGGEAFVKDIRRLTRRLERRRSPSGMDEAQLR